MAEIMWHRRETRRQTENTNVMPVALEGLILLDTNSNPAVEIQENAVARFPETDLKQVLWKRGSGRERPKSLI